MFLGDLWSSPNHFTGLCGTCSSPLVSVSCGRATCWAKSQVCLSVLDQEGKIAPQIFQQHSSSCCLECSGDLFAAWGSSCLTVSLVFLGPWALFCYSSLNSVCSAAVFLLPQELFVAPCQLQPDLLLHLSQGLSVLMDCIRFQPAQTFLHRRVQNHCPFYRVIHAIIQT